MLDFENSQNPYWIDRKQIAEWKRSASVHVPDSVSIRTMIRNLTQTSNLKAADAAHVACAILAGAECFLTTDDAELKSMNAVSTIKSVNPVNYL